MELQSAIDKKGRPVVPSLGDGRFASVSWSDDQWPDEWGWPSG